VRAAMIALVTAFAAAAHASPADDLAHGRDSFYRKDFNRAIDTLDPLLYPREQLASPQDLIDAYTMLGAALYEVGRRAEARDQFQKVLQLEPGKTLDTLLFSSGVIRMFDDTKADIEAQRKRDETEREIQRKAEEAQKYIESLRVYETHPYYVNFVPFGAGQFQDHRIGKGILVAAGEVATGGASAGIWLYLVGKYGLESRNVPLASASTVRTLQQVEIATGLGFLGFYAYGVIDSLLHYKPRAQIQGDESLLPADLKPAKPKKTSMLDHLHLAPMLSPTSVGIGLAWEN